MRTGQEEIGQSLRSGLIADISYQETPRHLKRRFLFPPTVTKPSSPQRIPSGSPLRESAETVIECMQALANDGRSVVTAVLNGRPAVCDAHYPDGDEVDSSSGFRYYYHTHDNPAWQKREHGHFHLFHEGDGRFHHLIAVSVDARGLPLRLFTTNQWVTGEAWVPASHIQPQVPRYTVAEQGGLTLVTRWLNALVALFADTIQTLIQARDLRVREAVNAGRDRERVLNDRRIHVLSQTPISLMERIDAVS